MDNRPFLPGYAMYVDGAGTLHEGSRWMNYCGACKGLIHLSSQSFTISAHNICYARYALSLTCIEHLFCICNAGC